MKPVYHNNYEIIFCQDKHNYVNVFSVIEGAVSLKQTKNILVINIITDSEIKFKLGSLDIFDSIDLTLFSPIGYVLSKNEYTGKISLLNQSEKNGFYTTKYQVLLNSSKITTLY